MVSPADRARALRRAQRDASKVKVYLPAPAARADGTPATTSAPPKGPQRTSTPIVVTAQARARALRRALADGSRVSLHL